MNCAPFVTKTYRLVSDKSTDHIVSWTEAGTFSIWNSQAFQEQVLPQYFKHNNLCSFIRQLNTYSFHKINSTGPCDGLEFSHESFIQGAKHLLQNIKRKQKKSKKTASAATTQPNIQVTAAILSLVKRQQESDQLLMSLRQELQHTRTVLSSLQSPSFPSVCGKRNYNQVQACANYPAPKRVKVEPEIPCSQPEMFTFDNLFQSSSCTTTLKDFETFDFNISELLVDL